MSPTGSSTFDRPAPGWLRQPQPPKAMPTLRKPRRPAVCFEFTGLPVPDCQAGNRGAAAAGRRISRRAVMAAVPATKPVQRPQPSALPDVSARFVWGNAPGPRRKHRRARRMNFPGSDPAAAGAASAPQ